MIGVNPDPYTLRQLLWMVEGKGEFEWQMTSSLMALEINMNRKPGSRAVSPNEFNPFMQRPETQMVKLSAKESMSALKQVFVRN